MKTFFLSLTFLLFSLSFFSQEYYVFEKKNEILNQFQLEEKILKLNKNLKKNKPKDATHIYIANYKIIKTFKRNDSIINSIRLNVKYKATEIEKIYSLKNKKLPELNLKRLKEKI